MQKYTAQKLRVASISLLLALLSFTFLWPLHAESEAEIEPETETTNTVEENKKTVDVELILLGTGYPRPTPTEAGPATAIIVNNKVFIIDTGRAITMRYVAAKLPFKKLQAVLLTHLHSDHISGLPDLFATSWLFGRYTPLELYGPPGSEQLKEALLKFFSLDIAVRRDITEKHPGAGMNINLHLVKEGLIYLDEDLEILAFKVDHHPLKYTFGYRFNIGNKSIVISGDTAPSANLIKYAKNAQVLVHEAYLAEYFMRSKNAHDLEVAANLMAYHSTAEEAGKAAQAAGVETLLLTHLIPPHTEGIFKKRAAKYYDGRIIIGRDLLHLRL